MRAKLRELTGPSLVSPISGWWLELELGIEDSSQRAEQDWSSLRTVFVATLEKLIPSLQCTEPEQPIDCCISLARLLVNPIRLHYWRYPAPAALRQIGCALIRSHHHELIGEALAFSLALLQMIARPASGADRHIEGMRNDAVRIQQRAKAVTSHAFTNAVINHARERGLQLTILHENLNYCPLVQIGTGSRSRLLHSSGVDSDGLIGGHICHNKSYSQRILWRLGYSVPRHIALPKQVPVQQLVAAAKAIGYPCVLKPIDSERGRGVSINIRDEASLLQAAARAQEVTQAGLMLEQHVPGDYHRLVVIQGRLVRVLRLQPPHLIGDGQRSIREILGSPSSDQSQPGGVLCNGPVPSLNEQVRHQLQAEGWAPDSVPASGVRVVLRCDLEDRNDWPYQSILDRVDQSLHLLAEGVASALGMSNIGIDVLSPDITQGEASRQLWVNEVNAIQRLHPKMAPLALQTIFPDAQSAHIPVCVVVCDQDKNLADASVLRRLIGSYPGYAIALPVRLGKRLDPPLLRELQQERRVLIYTHPREALLNRTVDSLLFLIDWHELSQSGLPAPWVDELQSLGEPPSEMAKSWRRLMDTVQLRTDPFSACALPT